MTGKQKRYLRSKAHHLKPVFQVGKNDIGEEFVNQVLDYLEKNELMKINILNNSLYDVSDLEAIFNEYDVTTVQKIGKVIILYKESNNEKYRNIKLPS